MSFSNSILCPGVADAAANSDFTVAVKGPVEISARFVVSLYEAIRITIHGCNLKMGPFRCCLASPGLNTNLARETIYLRGSISAKRRCS